MFILYADNNKLTVLQRESVTSGSVNAYRVRFEFSPDWEGMIRKAVFRAGETSRSKLLDESGECTIPWEVLAVPHVQLLAGVYGTRGGEEVLPTIWADLGTILEGVAAGEDAQPPTPNIYEQILETAQEAVDTAQSVRKDADAGKFDGPRGEKGDPGNVMFATFSIHPDTGLLVMFTPEGYEGPRFSVKNGILEVSING